MSTCVSENIFEGVCEWLSVCMCIRVYLCIHVYVSIYFIVCAYVHVCVSELIRILVCVTSLP